MFDRQSFARPIAAAALMGLIAGCSDPTAPADPPSEPPPPAFETRWDADVTVRYVRASADRTCDGLSATFPVRVVNPGEYQYRITAVLGSTSYSKASNRYNEFVGTSYELGPGEIHNFANETWKFSNLRQGESVQLNLYSTEWDGTERDDFMNNKRNSLRLNPSSLLPSGGTRSDRALGVGDADCGLTLYYDVTVVQRQVEVGS